MKVAQIGRQHAAVDTWCQRSIPRQRDHPSSLSHIWHLAFCSCSSFSPTSDRHRSISTPSRPPSDTSPDGQTRTQTGWERPPTPTTGERDGEGEHRLGVSIDSTY